MFVAELNFWKLITAGMRLAPWMCQDNRICKNIETFKITWTVANHFARPQSDSLRIPTTWNPLNIFTISGGSQGKWLQIIICVNQKLYKCFKIVSQWSYSKIVVFCIFFYLIFFPCSQTSLRACVVQNSEMLFGNCLRIQTLQRQQR